MKYLTLVNPKLFNYKNVILYASDPLSEFIFCVCLQQSLFFTAFCDDNKIDERLWHREFYIVNIIKPDELLTLDNTAVVLSPEKYFSLQSENKLCGNFDYYFYDKNFADNSLLVINEEIKNRPLAVFKETGESFVKPFFLESFIKPFMLVSFDESDSGGEYNQMPVCLPSALKPHVGKINVLVNHQSRDVALSLLTLQGFDHDDVYIDVEGTLNSRSYVLKPWMHAKNKRLIEDHLYKIMEMNHMGRQIVSNFNLNADTEYIVTGPNIGDAGITASFSTAYKEFTGCKKVNIVCHRPCVKAIGVFPSVDGVTGLGNTEYWALVNYFFTTRKYDQKNVHFAYCRYNNCYDKDEVAGGFRSREKSWFNIIKEDYLNLPYSFKPERLNIPGFSEKQGVNLKNSVLFITGSITADNYLSKEQKNRSGVFFQKLADKLKSKGLDVYTNAHSGESFPGVLPLYTDIDELLGLSQHFCAVISVRCGLQEILCLTDCELYIIYEDGFTFEKENCEGFIKRSGMYSYQLKHENMEETINNITRDIKEK